VAGDFSPLTIEAGTNGPRAAPPSLVVAMAVGLGSVDMPVPSVAEWEWLNWKFPRAVHAGDTIYARWMLTQKRPPLGGAPSAIVVWRVDVHTTDGAVVAEGEIGAKVKRNPDAARLRVPEQTTGGSRRRRGRRSRANGAAAPPEPQPIPATIAAPIAASPAPAPKPERTSSSSRRRRRRRSSGSTAAQAGEPAAPAPDPEPPPPRQVPSTSGTPATSAKGIGGVLRRLRRS